MGTDTLIRPARRREAISGSCGSALRLPIGTFTLPEPTVVHKTGDYAAWWHDVLVPAGEYEVTTNGYWAFVPLVGTVTSAYTASHYGGRPLSLATGNPGPPQYENHADVGATMRVGSQLYLYGVAAEMADPDSAYTPAPGIEPVLVGWGSYANPMFGLVDWRN